MGSTCTWRCACFVGKTLLWILANNTIYDNKPHDADRLALYHMDDNAIDYPTIAIGRHRQLINLVRPTVWPIPLNRAVYPWELGSNSTTHFLPTNTLYCTHGFQPPTTMASQVHIRYICASRKVRSIKDALEIVDVCTISFAGHSCPALHKQDRELKK